MLNAHLAELYRIHSRILSATVFLIHSLASKVFNNLEVFFSELLIPALCLSMPLSEPAEFRSASSVHGSQNRSVLSHPPGVKPQRPSPEITQTPCKCTTIVYIYNI
jgi:hypothetical protein